MDLLASREKVIAKAGQHQSMDPSFRLVAGIADKVVYKLDESRVIQLRLQGAKIVIRGSLVQPLRHDELLVAPVPGKFGES